MDTTEEFSFPTSTDLYRYGIESPPLWRPSPHKTAKGKEDDDDGVEEKGSKLCGKASAGAGAGAEDDKMDILWEDFNEELVGGRSCSEEHMKLVKPSGGVFCRSPKRAGVLVFMRALRKLFWIQNSHGSVVKHA